jgi:hypothetical protein
VESPLKEPPGDPRVVLTAWFVGGILCISFKGQFTLLLYVTSEERNG